MKGIIAEIDGRKMIVIAKNGEFIKCKKLPHHNIGDEVNVQRTDMTAVYKKMSAIAASFLIFAMLSTGVYAYYTPYSYVSLDINPSLEFSVNRFEKVIGVHAFNEDAEKVLSASEDIKYKDIDTALEQILDTASDQGFLKKDELNSIMFVVSSGNKKEEKAVSNKISSTSTEVLSQLGSNYEVILETTKMNTYKEAKKQNISPGRVILANQFKEVKPDINEEDIKHMPLQQAIKQIEKKENKDKLPKEPEVKALNGNNKNKVKTGNKVKNIEELILEKNEDLGKKLTDMKNENTNKEKENLNDDNQGNNVDNQDDQGNQDNNNNDNSSNTETTNNNNKDNGNKKGRN